MTHKLNSINEIDNSRETKKLAMRIINIWSVQIPARLIVDMIFMDKNIMA